MANVHLDALSFTLTTTNTNNQQISTLIELEADDVPVEYIVGALTAGASRRTVWQNDKKPTKKNPKGKVIPTTDKMKWSDWVGRGLAPTVLVQEARKLTPEEIFAQAMADPEFMARYKAHQDRLAQEALDKEAQQ